MMLQNYNHQARDLPPIHEGEAVRIQLPGQKQWTLGTCTGMEGPRSYLVCVGGTEYRQNRRHLIQRNEPPLVEPEPLQLGTSEQHQPEEKAPDPVSLSNSAPAMTPVPNPPVEQQPLPTILNSEQHQPWQSTQQC